MWNSGDAARVSAIDIARRRFAGSRNAGAVIALAAALATTLVQAADAWVPTRHVDLVVPSGPGGSLDGTVRTIHSVWTNLKLLPVSSAVVNRPGGAHLIAYNAVAQKSGDPQQIGLATSEMLSGHILGRLPYTYRDVTPLAMMVTEYVAYAVRPDSPLKTGRDLLEVLKTRPESITFGMGGTRGGTYHIALGIPLQAVGGDIKAVRVAFFPAGGHVTQLLGGHVDVSVGGMALVVPHLMNGTLRLIAISSPKRLGGAFTEVPTWEEAGVKGQYGSRRMIFGPAGLTPAQVQYWERVMRRVAESEEFQQTAAKNHWEVTFRDSADTRKFLDREYNDLKSAMNYLGLLTPAAK